jgi:hypothetical protein
MTPDRARPYHRVVETLRDLGPSKLLQGEQAADQLVFASDAAPD